MARPSSKRLRTRLRRDRIEAAWLTLSVGPVQALGQGQEPEGTSREALSRRRLGTLTPVAGRRFPPPWSIEDIGAAFVVKDGAGQKLAQP